MIMASELKLVSKPIVEIKNLTKEFDFVRALDDVSLEIPEIKRVLTKHLNTIKTK